jgi:hypothetical protein
MQATLDQQKFRGISCRYCGRPIRLPASILKREHSFKQNEPNPTQEWRSKVFPHRCNKCRVEAIYSLDEIVDFEDNEPA